MAIYLVKFLEFTKNTLNMTETKISENVSRVYAWLRAQTMTYKTSVWVAEARKKKIKKKLQN